MRELKELCNRYDLYMGHFLEEACDEENIRTLSELIERMNDIDSLPLGKFHGVIHLRDIEDFICQNAADELPEFDDLLVFPIHLTWDLYEEELMRFDISKLPQNTEIDSIPLKNRIINTLKLNGIYTINELVDRFRDPDSKTIQYLLGDDYFNITMYLVENDYIEFDYDDEDYDDEEEPNIVWKPKKDAKHVKVSPNAAALSTKLVDTELNPKIRSILEKQGIVSLEDIFLTDEKGVYEIKNTHDMPGLGNAGHTYLKMELNRLGYYV